MGKGCGDFELITVESFCRVHRQHFQVQTCYLYMGHSLLWKVVMNCDLDNPMLSKGSKMYGLTSD